MSVFVQVRKLKMSIFLGSKLRSKDLIFNDFQVFWPEFGLQKYGYLRNWRYPYFWRPNSGQKTWKSLKIKSFDRSLASKNMDIFNFLTCNCVVYKAKLTDMLTHWAKHKIFVQKPRIIDNFFTFSFIATKLSDDYRIRCVRLNRFLMRFLNL